MYYSCLKVQIIAKVIIGRAIEANWFFFKVTLSMSIGFMRGMAMTVTMTVVMR